MQERRKQSKVCVNYGTFGELAHEGQLSQNYCKSLIHTLSTHEWERIVQLDNYKFEISNLLFFEKAVTSTF